LSVPVLINSRFAGVRFGRWRLFVALTILGEARRTFALLVDHLRSVGFRTGVVERFAGFFAHRF
jgi:hypothetical protein